MKNEILKYFDYDPLKGLFFWRSHWNPSSRSRLVGKLAGCITVEGYRSIMLKGKSHKNYRLVWLMEKDELPFEIDHINGNRSDDRIGNLRECTRRENSQNKKSHREGRLVGSCWDKSTETWVSTININGRSIRIGRHATELQAHLAYMKKLKEFTERKHERYI